VIRFLRVGSNCGGAGDSGVQGDCKSQSRFVLLVILGSALDVLLNICVGISLLVRVVEQYVVGVRLRVVRGDYAVVGVISCEVLADFCVDKSVSCCA
jgi:hypothetical protein